VSVTLGRSDTLVLYTDGLIEARKDIIVGLTALEQAASETARYPAPQLARALVERALSGAARRDDSLTLVLRRRTAPVATGIRRLGPFEYRFSPNAASVSLARHLLADWLEHQPVDPAETADLLLVASELCSNAIRHATGAPGSVLLRAWTEGSAVVLEVEDDGGGSVEPGADDGEVPDPAEEQGRGLYLVRTLTDDCTMRVEDGRTIVRCTRTEIVS
jgi:anti-sigma regulatory factor (Ser/Thr protein kinase)